MCDNRQIDVNFPMTREEFQDYLRVSKYTLQDYLAEGLNRVGFKVGREYRFIPLDVVSWLKDRQKKNHKVGKNMLSKNELKLIALRGRKGKKSREQS